MATHRKTAKPGNAQKPISLQDYVEIPRPTLLDGVRLLRLIDIVGDRKHNIPGIIPLGRTSFLNRVNTGEFPKPVKLGEGKTRAVAWRANVKWRKAQAAAQVELNHLSSEENILKKRLNFNKIKHFVHHFSYCTAQCCARCGGV